MESGGLEASKESPGGVKPQKTYAQILEFREARLAREALQERRAAQLTKRFLQMREEEEQERAAREAEASQRTYEDGMHRLKKAAEADALMKAMMKEERSQVYDLMLAKGRQRESEMAQTEFERASLQRRIQGHKLYDQFEFEKRLKAEEEAKQMRISTFKERQDKVETVAKQVMEEKAEAVVQREQRHAAELERVAQRRRQQLIEQRKGMAERLASLQSKHTEAEQRRQQREEAVIKTLQERGEVRQRKIKEVQQKAEEDVEEKREKLFDKIKNAEASYQERWNARLQASVRSQPPLTERTPAETRRSAEAGEPHQEKHARSVSPITHWSKELIDASDQAKKAYVMRSSELQEAALRMRTMKKFKALASEAKGRDSSNDDVCTARMRALHNTYIAQKTREPKTDAAKGGAEPAHSHTPRKAGGGRRIQRCGLCERDFPSEGLASSVSLRTVEQYKDDVSGHGGKLARRRAPRALAASGADRAEAIDSSESRAVATTGKAALYDYEVKVCTACHHVLRIHFA